MRATLELNIKRLLKEKLFYTYSTLCETKKRGMNARISTILEICSKVNASSGCLGSPMFSSIRF